MTPDAAPPGKTLVHALVTSEHARALFALNDDDIVRRAIEEMRRFFPAMPERPLFARVYRCPEAKCLSPGGMLRDMHNMHAQLDRCMRGLFLAGDYTGLPSLNGAMKSGVEATEASLSYVASASRGGSETVTGNCFSTPSMPEGRNTAPTEAGKRGLGPDGCGRNR